MKNEVSKFFRKNHCYTKYSGHTKTMYIESCWDKHGFNHVSHVIDLARFEFGRLPFKIQSL